MSIPKFMVILFSINFTFIPLMAFSQECSSVDLRDKYPDKVRDQGGISWCYAFSASDQLKYHWKTPDISAPHVALEYNQTWPALTIKNMVRIIRLFKKNKDPLKEHQTGFIKTAIKRSVDVGLCSRKKFPDLYVEKVDIWRHGSHRVGLRDAITDINNNLKFRLSRESIQDIGYYYRWGKMSAGEFETIVKKHNAGKILLNLARKSCEGNEIKIKDKNFKVVQWPKYFNVMAAIDSQLDRRNLASIDYNSDILDNPKKSSILNIGALHTSSIIGRRFNQVNRQCEYLIRNSWGESCERYLPRFTCEAGNIWVDETTLKKNILLVTYIEDN
ncbi:MAG: hypothetical protein QE271_11765 [Bacteriovoracaceae bacterium]|nr:hypothetical protein [Bacteriovoracaceae bacterium]